MARAPALSSEKLVALGAERLAQLVLDGVARDPAFKRLVTAALAGTKGPQAVAALVEKRLAGLERARGFVEWDKVKAFAADLDATVKTVVDDIGPADAGLATTILLRFLKTADGVLDRVDDSQGRVQAVYAAVVEALGPLVARLSTEDRRALPERITAALGSDAAGDLPRLIQVVGPHLGEAGLAAWDARLAAAAGLAGKGRHAAFEAEIRASQVLAARQTIALVRRDLDAFAALEATKPSNRQDGLALARLFLDAGRAAEALSWVRKSRGAGLRYLRLSDMADHVRPLDHDALQRARLEAEILDALGKRPAAQTLRWTTFTETLDPEILRAYMGALGEFEEFEALDRSFAHVEAAPNIHGALVFLLEWPKLDKAAALVVLHRDRWQGESYDLLAPAADTLEPEHPIAAALLYRRLLDAILTRGQSNAYGHGARYLARLDALAPDLDRAAFADVPRHDTYRAGLAKAHGRKSAFWSRLAKPDRAKP